MPKEQIRLSLAQASVEFGVPRETLRRKLQQMVLNDGQVAQADRADWTIAECHKALSGDLTEEKTLLTRAQRIAQETENRIIAGDLTPSEKVKRDTNAIFGPIIARIKSIPSIASLCNPSDPENARLALTQWMRETMAFGKSLGEKEDV